MAAHICFSLIVMCTVISFSRPHVCPEMDQVQNSNPSKFPCPCLHRHQYSASRSPAASPLTQTPGKKMGTIESCHPMLINSVSYSLFLSFDSQFCLLQGGNTPVVLTNLVQFKWAKPEIECQCNTLKSGIINQSCLMKPRYVQFISLC